MVSSISSTLGNGVAGISAGVQRAQEAASDIANLGRDDAQLRANPEAPASQSVNRAPETASAADERSASLEESVVALRQAEIQVAASAQVVDTADEVLGTLIDTTA